MKVNKSNFKPSAMEEKNESPAERKREVASGEDSGANDAHHKGGQGFHSLSHSSGMKHDISHHADGIHHTISHPSMGAHNMTHSPNANSTMTDMQDNQLFEEPGTVGKTLN